MYLFIFLCRNLQDLSSLTKNWIQVKEMKAQNPNNGATRELTNCNLF